MSVPSDIPSDMIPAFLEGKRCGRIRDKDSGYQSEIDELEADEAGCYSLLVMTNIVELKERQVYFERGFAEGQATRHRLKGGT